MDASAGLRMPTEGVCDQGPSFGNVLAPRFPTHLRMRFLRACYCAMFVEGSPDLRPSLPPWKPTERTRRFCRKLGALLDGGAGVPLDALGLAMPGFNPRKGMLSSWRKTQAGWLVKDFLDIGSMLGACDVPSSPEAQAKLSDPWVTASQLAPALEALATLDEDSIEWCQAYATLMRFSLGSWTYLPRIVGGSEHTIAKLQEDLSRFAAEFGKTTQRLRVLAKVSIHPEVFRAEALRESSRLAEATKVLSSELLKQFPGDGKKIGAGRPATPAQAKNLRWAFLVRAGFWEPKDLANEVFGNPDPQPLWNVISKIEGRMFKGATHWLAPDGGEVVGLPRVPDDHIQALVRGLMQAWSDCDR